MRRNLRIFEYSWAPKMRENVVLNQQVLNQQVLNQQVLNQHFKIKFEVIFTIYYMYYFKPINMNKII